MTRLKALTVTQSMKLILLGGMAATLIFATALIGEAWKDRRALERDHALLTSATTTGAIVHALQRERGMTSAWLAGPATSPDAAMTAQRAIVDAAIAALPADLPPGDNRATPDRRDDLGDWLAKIRAGADAGRLTSRSYRDAMSDRIADLISTVARSAEQARSPRVALQMRELAVLMAAKNATELERAIGEKMLSRREAGRGADPLDPTDLRDQGLERQTWIAALRLASDPDFQSYLDLWENSDAVRQFERQRVVLLESAEDGRPARHALSAWIESAGSRVEALWMIEQAAIARLTETLTTELAAERRALIEDLLLLASTLALFGGLSIVTIRRVDRSVAQLTRSVGRLCVDPEAPVSADCPQGDLNRIAQALRVLRLTQVGHRRAMEEAEQLRQDVDIELSTVVDAASRGQTDRRLELLGLDGHGAALARGVNRLLDQIEKDTRSGSA